jgi:hypothetical protein
VTTASARARRRAELTLARLDLDRLALPALAVAALASGLLLFHLTRDTSFWADDWTWIARRRGDTVNTFLSPYNGHLSLIPIAIYRLMFATFGLGSYTPYRTLVICLSVGVAALVFAYARTRVGGLLALLLAASMLFLGPGWQQTMWGFQVPWLLVSAAGISALMLLDRGNRAGDIAACALILFALASTSLAVAISIGLAVDIALYRRRWRDAWIVVIPWVGYAAWTAYYHPSQLDLTQITEVPLKIVQAGAAALSDLTGLSGVSPSSQSGTSLTYGVPMLVLAAALLIHAGTRGRFNRRAVSLLVTLIAFVVSVTLAHDGLAGVLSSRYVYVYCLLTTLLVAELARGVRLTRAVQWALCLVTALAIVSNIGILRSFGNYLRQSGEQTNGALGGLELDRASVAPDTLARVALYPFIKLSARSYFSAADALGTPAFTAAQLQHADLSAQAAADAQLIADGTIALRGAGGPGDVAGAGGRPPTVDSATDGTATRARGCVRFVPSAALAPGAIGTLAVTVGAGPDAVSVNDTDAATTVSVRRFAPTFTALGTAQAGASAVVLIRHDATGQPWHVQLQSLSPIRICSAPGA